MPYLRPVLEFWGSKEKIEIHHCYFLAAPFLSLKHPKRNFSPVLLYGLNHISHYVTHRDIRYQSQEIQGNYTLYR